MFSLNSFREQVVRPARPTLFKVNVDIGVINDSDFEFFCQASTVPGVSVGAYQIKYQGREIQYAGDLTFDPWKVTIINQEGNNIRELFEQWFQKISGFDTGLRDFLDSIDYKGTAQITQITQDGQTAAAYQAIGLFPTILDPLVLDWSQTDQYQTFDVTFAFDWWTTDEVLNSGADTLRTPGTNGDSIIGPPAP